MLRVVLDTSVLVAGLRSRLGASNAVLKLVAQGAIRPLTTTALFLEYEDVLSRPEHRIATGHSTADIETILSALASASEPVDVHFRWRPQLRDPADELVLEAAVNGRADRLVTHNVRDFEIAAADFGLEIRRPAQLLQEIP